MRRPQRETQTGMPGRVTIYEVGPRDGLQNEKAVVPVEVKAEFIRRLVAAGLDMVETTSFVPPAWVPQLADSAELLGLLGGIGRGRNRPVLVPNERGLDAALTQGVQAIAIFGSATETFARKNLNRGVQESIAMFAPVVERARVEGLWVRAYVSMCFGDPWEGDVPIDQVVDVASRMMDLGCDQLSLGDTIGTGTTGHVHRLLDALDTKGIGAERIGVHFHDTYGQALANTLAAVTHGVTVVDASAGGLGGCPYARSATGNLATEDLVWALDGLGIETGVDLDALVETSVWMAANLGRPSPSRVVRALAGSSEGGGLSDQTPVGTMPPKGIKGWLHRRTQGIVTNPSPVLPALTEPGECHVVLQVTGANPVKVIKVIREATGLSILAARDLALDAPVVVVSGISEASAQRVVERLQKAGAKAVAGEPYRPQ